MHNNNLRPSTHVRKSNENLFCFVCLNINLTESSETRAGRRHFPSAKILESRYARDFNTSL
jgi:hypothetical protein